MGAVQDHAGRRNARQGSRMTAAILPFARHGFPASEGQAQAAYLRALELQRAVVAKPSFANICKCADAWRAYCRLFAALDKGRGS